MSEPITNTAPAPTQTNAAAAPAATPPAPEASKAAPPAQTQSPKAEDSKKAAEPSKAEIRRLKLKLDGADIELSEDEVVQLAQLSAGAQKRFMEASQSRKQTEDLLQFLKTNPIEAMRRLGLDPRKISEEHLVSELKKEAESPEQKRIREAEDKIRAYEATEKQRKEEDDRKAAEAKKSEEER